MKALSIQKTRLIPAVSKYSRPCFINEFVNIDIENIDDIERIIENPIEIWNGPTELTGKNIYCCYSSDNTTKDKTISVLVENPNARGPKEELFDNFCGNIVFVSVDPETNEIRNMTEDQITTIKSTFLPVTFTFRKTDIKGFTFKHRPNAALINPLTNDT